MTFIMADSIQKPTSWKFFQKENGHYGDYELHFYFDRYVTAWYTYDKENGAEVRKAIENSLCGQFQYIDLSSFPTKSKRDDQ